MTDHRSPYARRPSMSANRIAIVIPVFNDRASLDALLKELAGIFRGADSRIHLVIVDDGSLPPLAKGIADLGAGLPGEILSLKRNVGHQRAIAIGISHAVESSNADLIAVMDADGEDRPSDVPRLIGALDASTEMAIAVGQRARRSEGVLFAVLYWIYRLLFHALTGQSIRFGNFMAMRQATARRLADMSELWLSLAATVLRSRFPIVMVPAERGRRTHGVSHMNLVSLVVHAFSTMAVFIERVLTRMILGALVLVGLCALAIVAAVTLKLTGSATPGWLTTVLGTSVVLLVSVGVLCFVGLFVGIIGGMHSVSPPSVTYRSSIAGVTKLGAGEQAAAEPGKLAAVG